jgi:TatD DNase family protein
MEYAYRYGDPRRLYLNVTNRCTNRCSFCVRNRASGLGGAMLRGGPEPDFAALCKAILAQGGAITEYIWCGFGEPTFRLDLILDSARWLRRNGAKIRLNTNGHAGLIHNRDVLPELAAAVDEVSISLNAPNPRKYLELCKPGLDQIVIPRDRPAANASWDALMDFLSRAPRFFRTVQASVVGYVLTQEEVEQSRLLALSLGVERFRVR